MTDREALYAAILASPEDDLPRLVWADWLEEHGEQERAVHLRAQVELARLAAVGDLGTGDHQEALRAAAAAPSAALWESVTRDGLPVGAPVPLARDTDGDVDWVREDPPGLALGLRRGLVEEVRCRTAWWLASAAQVVSHAPVRRVGLTDRSPARDWFPNWCWSLQGWGGPDVARTTLPNALYSRLARPGRFVTAYLSRVAAEDALSDACLAYARYQLEGEDR